MTLLRVTLCGLATSLADSFRAAFARAPYIRPQALVSRLSDEHCTTNECMAAGRVPRSESLSNVGHIRTAKLRTNFGMLPLYGGLSAWNEHTA